MGEPEMVEVASLMAAALRAPDDPGVAGDVKETVNRLCSKFTPYPET
jgi:glycine/serine hydroxymethyltransferase